MGADYSFYVKNIETHARAFLTLNVLAIGRVTSIANFEFKVTLFSEIMPYFCRPHTM